jgi:tRNA(Leu) C34 or U34 (ribose-2'-O)-methylase TrmL
MVTVVFHFTDFDDYPGGDLPQSTMSAWVHDVKAFGADKIIMIDKTSYRIGKYYNHNDDSILFERYETLEECMDMYPNDMWVFIEMDDRSVNLTEFNHPDNVTYVVGADFSRILCEREPNMWLKIPMLHHRPLYAHVAMMIVLYDRMLKL